MLRGAVVLLSAALAGAPFQCTGDPDPASAMEETPGQALYELAEQFREAGDESAWRDTLKYLIERYPSSRYAETARQDLEAGMKAGPPGSSGPPESSGHTAASP